MQSVTIVYESSAIELQRGWSINHLGNKIDFFETQQHEVGRLGCIKIFKSLVHNPDQKELNELRTRIFFFLKLDNGKSGLWVPLNSRLMTSSGHVTKMK